MFAYIVDAGKLTPVVDEQYFDLEKVGKADERLARGQVMGNVVVSV